MMRVSSMIRAAVSFGSSLSIQVKLAVMASLLSILVATFVSVYGAHAAGSALRQELRSKLASVAASVAANLDATRHEAVWALGDESSEDYRALKAYLRALRDANADIRYIYTMVPTEDPNTWHFVVDAEDDPDLVSHIGDPYDAAPYPALRAALQGPTADQEIENDQWGSWLSGYAPIRTQDRKAIGIVGVDMSAEAVAAEEASIRQYLGISLLIATLISAALGILLARRFIAPIQRLVWCTERVAQGDLHASAAVERGDELGHLAKRFNEMIDRLRENRETLLKLANVDALTGLSNHRRAQELLAEELRRALRSEHPLGVMVLDVDNFKLFNDTHGHRQGDEVLGAVANLLTSSLRATDPVARYGPDTFLVILPETDAAGVNTVGRHLLARMGELAHVDGNGVRIPLTCSIGSSVSPFDSCVQGELVSLAETAMQEVQRAGGNGYQAANLSSVEMLRAQNTTFGVLEGLVQTVDSKDHYTKQHSEMVTRLSLSIAAQLGLPDETRSKLRVAGLLHDVGKIGIPNSILRKPAKLTDEEFEIMKQHPLLGAMIIQEVPHLGEVVTAVRHHHERFDGRGYPHGLRGSEIPLISRILGVADAYSAMITDRPYRKALEHEAALEELRRHAGAQFDPAVVDAFLNTRAESTVAA